MRASASLFLSLWIKDIRFQLDTIVPLPRFVSQDSFQTVCDDKSGYDNREILFFYPRKVALQLASNGLAGTLSSTLYVLAGRVQRTSTILPVWLFLFRIPCSLNMDDRYTGQRFFIFPTAFGIPGVTLGFGAANDDGLCSDFLCLLYMYLSFVRVFYWPRQVNFDSTPSCPISRLYC